MGRRANLYYSQEGSGEPLLFVHGWTCDSTDFVSQLAHFRARYRVIAPDLCGHGRSPAAAACGYEARELARDLVDLLDMLDVDRCAVIGHSLGGLVASVLAVEYPQRVRAVVCLDPAYGVGPEGVDSCRALIERMRGPEGIQALAQSMPGWEGPATPLHFRELHVRRALAMDEEVVRKTFEALFLGCDPLAIRARSEDYLSRRACPAFTLYTLAGPERAAWEARQFRHEASRAMHLPLGHWPQQDAPDLINALIEQWLQRQS